MPGLTRGPWGRGWALRVSFQASGAAVQSRGQGRERCSVLKRRALHLVCPGLRAPGSPERSGGHPGTVARSRHTRAHFPWGSEPRAAQEPRAPSTGNQGGKEGRAGGSRLTCSQLLLPPCCPGVPAHDNRQRQLAFAKFGLAPPEKRREPAKERRARFLERGPPELGKGNAINSAREVNI